MFYDPLLVDGYGGEDRYEELIDQNAFDLPGVNEFRSRVSIIDALAVQVPVDVVLLAATDLPYVVVIGLGCAASLVMHEGIIPKFLQYQSPQPV